IGTELNLSYQKAKNNLVNSNEFSFTNNILFPRLVTPFRELNKKRLPAQQTFITTSLSYIKRYNYFDLKTLALGMGYEWNSRPSRKWIFRPFNFEFSYLDHQSHIFDSILHKNLYLQYSFNTALVMGSSFGYAYTSENGKHIFRSNIEESGLLWGRLGIFKNYMKQFVKLDLEYTNIKPFVKSSLILRAFTGIGVPVGKNETSLPFFKQYYGGGANSMRGWPIRGIGRGGQTLTPYDSITFNDRTGDIKLELNAEYRYNIITIIPNSLVLRGALFIDAGNIWNFKNTKTGGGADSLQFQFENLYKQLGISAGTGFRFDFNYFLIRFDFGFRFKRPDLIENDGWKAPSIGFDDGFKKIFTRGENNEYRKWRYENFNFSIGLSYPF
ncbi:MAG: BamA/TamA family outer membrane protein, partial [Sphingobacteriales bacterium]|nr:BamA/TamA family outer membrane protein [Sphingobacteriales bacterium]